MPTPEPPDHDQRLKVLLREFFAQFLECFFPVWASRFDLGKIEWLDKEVFLNPPQGETRVLDLVARLNLRQDAPKISEEVKDLVALLHIEVESRESMQPLRPRMLEYYVHLRREKNLPVLPIGLFLRVGNKGIGWDRYQERFWEHTLIQFHYAYVGLPALKAVHYINGENLLGVALSSLMKVPKRRKAELYAEALKRVALAPENDARRFLLAECLEAYSELNEKDTQRLHKLLDQKPFKEVKPLMITTYERGKNDGILDGILQGERRLALNLLEAKFGNLPKQAIERLNSMDSEALRKVMQDSYHCESLKDLGLED